VGYIHSTVTVIWFGTLFYVHVILGPEQLTAGMPKTEGIIGRISMFVMALTGIALAIFRYLETGFVYTRFFGTVFIIKLILFAIMVILAFIAFVPLDRRLRQSGGLVSPPPASSEEITSETLSSFDGEGGRRAIVAVGGKLYDVTSSQEWPDGAHMGRHQAGHDLTQALKGAPHDEELLGRVPMIGVLTTATAKARPRRPPALRVFLTIGYVNLALMFGILLCVAWLKWGFS
jgi:predicted heme/steroid binding protein